jgi:hypothetical protein
MKQIISWGKTLLIVGLGALAVFQVYRLWLVDLAAGSFFLYLEARFPVAAPDGQDAFARPKRVMHGTGGVFTANYTPAEDWEPGRSAIDAVLTGGTFLGQSAAEAIYNSETVIFEYAFYQDAGRFAQSFGRSAALLTDNGVHSFSAVAVTPGGYVDFIYGDTAFGFQIQNLSVANLHRLDADITGEVTFTRYYGRWLAHFPPGFSYTPIEVTNPYMNHLGVFNQNFVRERVAPFFDNPASINQHITGGIFTYSNLNVVVRYLPGHVLEYTSFRTIGRTAPATFMGDFSAALAFVAADPYVVNNIYLAGYEMRGREHVFYFGLTEGGWPLTLAEPWPTRPDCTEPLIHPIEVVVDHGRVVRYRRLVFNFHAGAPAWPLPGVSEPRFVITGEPVLRMGVQ